MRYLLLRKSAGPTVLVTLAIILVSAASAGAVSKVAIHPAKPTPGTRVLNLVPRPKGNSVVSVGVSRDGNTVVVGQPGDFDDRSQTGTTAGAVYVFVRASASSGWRQKAVLAAPAGSDAGVGFGQAVAVSAKGTEIAVGAPGASVGGHLHNGAVYVFTRSSGGWSSKAQAASLTPSDPSDGKGIGGAVAISGTVVVAGNNHSLPVYLFMRQGSRWASETQTAELSRPQAPGQCPSNPFNTFGAAVAVDGQRVAVGDTTYPSARTCNVSGAVFVFQRPSGGWANSSTPTAPLQAKDGGHENFVGQSIALQGSTLVAGAPNAMVRGFPDVGAAYVFQRPKSGWTNATETARLTPSVLYSSDLFGSTVGISGTSIVASNSFCPNGASACPFVFRKSGGSWQGGKQIRALVPPVSSSRQGGLPQLATGGNTAVEVATIKTLPVVLFNVSKAAKTGY